MDRVVLHSDCNCFYASVEMHRHPELRGTAMCVGGDVESRHGIVLAKSRVAKASVQDGRGLWQAGASARGSSSCRPTTPPTCAMRAWHV